MVYNQREIMKNQLITLSVIILISILFAGSQTNWFLGFVNSLGSFSILFIFISGFILLENFGYFDVFGYTFKKTYYVLSGKSKDFDEHVKERYASLYNYAHEKQKHRISNAQHFYLSTLILFIIALSLSLLYSNLFH